MHFLVNAESVAKADVNECSTTRDQLKMDWDYKKPLSFIYLYESFMDSYFYVSVLITVFCLCQKMSVPPKIIGKV